MNRKAFQLAISTLILIVLGIAVLIALILALTDGFERFKETTDPFLDTTEAIAVKQACELACETNTANAFCCLDRELKDEIIKCSDSKLQITCSNINCGGVICNPTTPEKCESKGGTFTETPSDISEVSVQECPEGTSFIASVSSGKRGICCK